MLTKEEQNAAQHTTQTTQKRTTHHQHNTAHHHTPHQHRTPEHRNDHETRQQQKQILTKDTRAYWMKNYNRDRDNEPRKKTTK